MKSKNTLLSVFFLTIILVLTTMCGLKFQFNSTSHNAFAETVILASPSDCTFEGTGTSENPYLISSESQLCELSSLVSNKNLNADGRLYSSLCYKLTQNLDMSGINFCPIGNSEPLNGYLSMSKYSKFISPASQPENWIYAKKILYKYDGSNYIENDDESFNVDEEYYYYYDFINSFYGEFDGNGKTISNLNSTGYSESGLFGRIQNALIKNIVLDNAEISGTSCCGGITGISIFSEINHCYVINSNISSSYENSICGGIIGYCPIEDDYIITVYDEYGAVLESISVYEIVEDFINIKRNSRLSLCLNNNSKIIAKAYSGGFCGKSDNIVLNEYSLLYDGLIVENCINYADISIIDEGIAGGIVGFSSGKINNCLSLKGCNNKNEHAILGEPLIYGIGYEVNKDFSFYPSELLTDTNLNYTYDTNYLLSKEFLTKMGEPWILPQSSNSTYYYPTIDINYAVPFTGFIVTVNDTNTYNHIVNSEYGKFIFPEYTTVPSGYSFVGYKSGGTIYNELDITEITGDTSIETIFALQDFNAQFSENSLVITYDSEYHYITVSYSWEYDAEVSATYVWYYSEDNTVFEERTYISGATLSLKDVSTNGYYRCLVTLSDGKLSTSVTTPEYYVHIFPKEAVLSVNLPYSSAEYSGNEILITPSLSYENVYDCDKSALNESFSCNNTVIKDVGTYTFSVTSINSNYSFTYVPQDFIVIPANIICSSLPNTVTYNGMPNYPIINATTVDGCKYTVTYSLTEDNYATTLPEITNAGNYTVYYAVNAENHESFYGFEQVTVNPNTITITKKTNAPIIEKTYDTKTSCPVELITDEHFSASFTGQFSGDSPLYVSSADFAVSKVISLTSVTVIFELTDTNNFILSDNTFVLDGKINYAQIDISIKENKIFEKIYDGTLTFPVDSFNTISSYLNIVAECNTYNIILYEGILNSQNVSDATTVTFNLILAGINYVFTDGSSSITFPARITPRELQIKEGSVTAINRKFDGTNYVELSGGELEIKPEDFGIFTLTENVYPVFGPASVLDAGVSSSEKYVYVEYIDVSSANYFVSDTLSGILTVTISKATPVVNPITKTEIFNTATELNAISLSEGDTQGTIEWEPYIINGLATQQTFSWLFTPVDTSNFTSLTGSIVIDIIKIKPTSLRTEFYGKTDYVALETFDTSNLTVYVQNNDGSEYKITERTSHESGFYIYYGNGDREHLYATDTEVSIRYNTSDGFIETFIPINVDIILLPTPTVIDKYTFNGNEIVLKLDSVFSSEIMSISGHRQLHAGTHTATLTLIDIVNYRWENSTEPTVEINWEIRPLAIHTPSLLYNEFIYNGETIIPDISHNELNPTKYYILDGQLSAIDASNYFITATFVSTDYYWYENDSNEPLILNWKILPCTVEIPILDKTVTEYDGNEHAVELLHSDLYEYSGDLRYKNAGNYTVMAILNDSQNYVWSNGSSEPISIEYTVLKPKYEKPYFQMKNYVFNGTTYSIPIFSTDFYTVNGQVSSRNCGDFTITVSLNDVDNMLWDDETTDPVIIRWAIQPAVLISPTLTSDCVYNGQQQAAFIVYDSKFCTLRNNVATESGSYTATVSIVDKQNCKWDNGTTGDIDIDWEITPYVVDIPSMPDNLLYNGFEQTVSIPKSSAYTITGDTGIDANSYTATIKLNDKNNYVWNDGKTSDVKINWKICSLTFSSNGSVIDTSYSLGNALPSPRIDGFVFDGWYASSDFSGEKITTLSAINENTVLYAKWIETEGNTLIKNDDGSALTDKAIAGIAILGGALLLAVLIIILGVVSKKKPRSGGGGRSIL